MPWPRFLAGVLLLLAGLLPAARAACGGFGPEWLWHYEGMIGDKYRVRMTLALDAQPVAGVYFYASQLRDIPVRGRFEGERGIVLEELDAQGRVGARFDAQFATTDPKGRLSGVLECEVITGTWQKAGAGNALPVYLALAGGVGGTLDHRYAAAGAEDDETVHRNAYRFWDGVRRDQRKEVAALVAYPIKVQLPGGARRLRNAAELLAHYDAIFTPAYPEAIAAALPRNMFARDQGITLGSGEVWFGPDGRVIALNTH